MGTDFEMTWYSKIWGKRIIIYLELWNSVSLFPLFFSSDWLPYPLTTLLLFWNGPSKWSISLSYLKCCAHAAFKGSSQPNLCPHLPSTSTKELFSPRLAISLLSAHTQSSQGKIKISYCWAAISSLIFLCGKKKVWDPVGADNATGRGTPFLCWSLDPAGEGSEFWAVWFISSSQKSFGLCIENRETGSRFIRQKHLRKGSADMNGLVSPGVASTL